MARKRNPPSDRDILRAIYEKYYDTFVQGAETRDSIFTPIDVEGIAKSLGVDRDVVFGRLYYYLNRRHGYEDHGSHVLLYAKVLGTEHDCVNLPLIGSVLAGLDEEHDRTAASDRRAWIAIVISLVSLVVSIALAFARQS
jgi:hypothetical protein